MMNEFRFYVRLMHAFDFSYFAETSLKYQMENHILCRPHKVMGERSCVFHILNETYNYFGCFYLFLSILVFLSYNIHI